MYLLNSYYAFVEYYIVILTTKLPNETAKHQEIKYRGLICQLSGA